MSFLESKIKTKSFFQIIGIDEVGRGPLAGPVVACGVSFKGNKKQLNLVLKTLSELKVTDSKKISDSKRQKILSQLNIPHEKLELCKGFKIPNFENSLEFYLIGLDNEVVDKENILQASLKAMSLCVHNLREPSDSSVWIDGNKKPKDLINDPKVETIIKGDSKSALIALASIIAKEYRDNLMKKYAETFPEYGFELHSGYPTKKHKEAIQKWGITPIHRKTFKGVKEYLK